MIPSQVELNRLHAEICTGLADPIRISILYLLQDAQLNVSDIVDHLQLPQSTVSRHLRVLRSANLVQSERQGQNVFYQLTDPRVIDALDLLRAVMRERVSLRAQTLDSDSTSS